jgi:hypothetical protein
VNPTACLAPEELDLVLAAPEDDPRRVHARGCVRCGALVAEYESFREARERAPKAEIDLAVARLNALMASTLGAEAGAVPAGGASAAAAAPAPPEPPREPRRLVFPKPTPRFAWLRPALGFVAIAAVAGAMWWPRTTLGPSRVTLRGETQAAPRLAVEAPVFQRGRLAMRWAAYPGAERYDVRFYGSDLTELGRLSASEPSLDAGTAQLPFAPDSARGVLVRVVAMISGSEVASSVPRTIEVR